LSAIKSEVLQDTKHSAVFGSEATAISISRVHW